MVMGERRVTGGAPERPVQPERAAPSVAESWERHTRIAELVQQIRKRRGLPLSPAARPVAR